MTNLAPARFATAALLLAAVTAPAAAQSLPFGASVAPAYASYSKTDVFAYWNKLGLTTDPNRITNVNVDGGSDFT